jgi:ribosome-associated protein
MEVKKYTDLSDADALLIARQAALELLKKQGKAVKLFCVKDTTVIADYYLIASGRSSTHVKALADELSEKLALHGVSTDRIEGRDGGAWVLVDFGCVIAHVFDRESREYYNIERLLRPEDELSIEDLEALADEAAENL